MVSLSTMTTGDVVKSASVPETMASAVLGGAVNGVVTAALPGVNPLFTSIGMIFGGVMAGSIIKGKAGDVIQNALTITGAVKLSDVAMAMLGGIMGGGAVSADAETIDNSVIY